MKDLFEDILSQKELFILDVRNEDAFADWKIEGKNLSSINIPYFDLLDGVDDAMRQLPSEDVPVVVVCAKEGSSQYVAEELVNAGRQNVSHLQGGMKSWSEHLHPVKVGDLSSGGAIYQFVRVGKGCLSYMIVSGGEAAVVDAARITDAYVSFAQEHGVRIVHTLDTHLHADHISGGRALAEQFGGKYWLPPKDATEAEFDYEALEDGATITVGATTVKILPVYSPGHTIGSTSLIVDDKYLLSGDILFIQSIGRPDLAGKAEDWVADLRDSLYNKYKSLPEHLKILPAHYSQIAEMDAQGAVQATLGDLFTANAGLQVDDEDAFRTMVTKNLPPQPNAYQQIRQVNMGKLIPEVDEQREMEIGPNRCAVHG